MRYTAIYVIKILLYMLPQLCIYNCDAVHFSKRIYFHGWTFSLRGSAWLQL